MPPTPKPRPIRKDPVATGGDDASFYAHGQATIALCEAYALTRDPELLLPIQRALAFIAEAQHPETGGWKYRWHSAGDTSVFGWQIMALETVRMAGLDVPSGPGPGKCGPLMVDLVWTEGYNPQWNRNTAVS